MNKFFCWFTGGHKYADSNLKSERSPDSNEIWLYNRCIKCGALSVFLLDIDRIIQADMEEFKKRSAFIPPKGVDKCD